MPTYSDPSRPQPVPSIQIKSSAPDIGPILVVIGGIIMAAFAAYLYIQSLTVAKNTTAIQQETATAQVQRDSLNPIVTDAVTYNQLGDSLKKLFDGQKLWSATLGNVEKHMYRHLAITNLQIDDKGVMTLSGTTTSYSDYARIYSSFTDPSVANVYQNVVPSAVSKDDKGVVTFTFTMNLSPTQITYASSAS